MGESTDVGDIALNFTQKHFVVHKQSTDSVGYHLFAALDQIHIGKAQRKIDGFFSLYDMAVTGSLVKPGVAVVIAASKSDLIRS